MTYWIGKGCILDDIEGVVEAAEKHNKIYQPFKCFGEFELDIESILRLETMGFMFATKLVIEGQTRGFINSCIVPSTHYKNTKHSYSDVIYIDPKLGKQRIKLLKEMIAHHEWLGKTEYGVQVMQLSISAHKDISRLIESIGYTKTDIILSKRIHE